jgi:hypothetical protein
MTVLVMITFDLIGQLLEFLLYHLKQVVDITFYVLLGEFAER